MQIARLSICGLISRGIPTFALGWATVFILFLINWHNLHSWFPVCALFWFPLVPSCISDEDFLKEHSDWWLSIHANLVFQNSPEHLFRVLRAVMSWRLGNQLCDLSICLFDPKPARTRLKCPWGRDLTPTSFPSTVDWAAHQFGQVCSRVCGECLFHFMAGLNGEDKFPCVQGPMVLKSS